MPTYYAPGKRKGNETWVIRGYVNGKQYEITTDARNKRAAEKAWQDYASDTRREQRDANRTSETATFDWACDEWLAAHPDHQRQYRLNVEKLRDQSDLALMLLADITVEDIYLAAHKMRPHDKPQSKNSAVITPAATVLHYMARRKLCAWLKVPIFKPIGVQRPITYPDQLERLIRLASDELKVLLMTFQIHGWRITETINIKRAQIDWKRAQIERWVSKSKEWRTAPVDREVLAAWKGLPIRADGKLFSYGYRRAVYIEIDRLIEHTGIDMTYRPHRSRRGLATALRDLGYSIDDIRDAAQWKNSASVLPYVKDDPERSRGVLEDLRGSLRGKARKAQ